MRIVACPPDPPDPPPCCPGGCPDYCYECVDCSCQCVEPPVGVLTYDTDCVGCLIYFAVGVHPYCCDHVVWSAPGGDPASQEGGCLFDTHWDTPGIKTVTATTSCDSGSKQVAIIKVGSIDAGGCVTGGPGYLYACLMSEVSLEAKPDPASAGFLCPVVWGFVYFPPGASPLLTPSPTNSAEATLSNMDKVGLYEIIARTEGCNGHYGPGATIKIMAVTIENIVEAGTADEGPLYVCVNKTVDLEARPDPADALLPAGQPTWTVENQPTGANASLSPSSSSLTTTLSSLSQAGDYLVKAKCCAYDPGDTITATAVEVASLLPDEGTEIDDRDGNPDTKSFLVCIADSGVVTVTATPNPDVPEQNLPDCWSLTGGMGTSLLSRTVDKTKTTVGATTITCTCGSSSKTTKIYVYRAKLKLYAKGGLSYIPGLLWLSLADFGHSWWKLEFSHPNLVWPATLRLYLDEEIGYWPEDGFPIYNPWAFVPGDLLVYDQGCTPWASGEWTITWEKLRAALYYSMILDNSPGEFSAVYHNCTDEAVTAGEVAGVETIDASDNPTMPLELVYYLWTH